MSFDEVGPNGELFDPTLRPHSNFDPEADVEYLKQAKEKKSKFEKALIEILAARSCEQRLKIASVYKAKFGKDLIDDIKNHTSGDLKSTLRLLMMNSTYMKAYSCFKAIEGLGTDEDCLIQILCSATNSEIIDIKNIYPEVLRDSGKNASNRSLEKDVINDTDGWFKKLLVAVLQGQRKEPSLEQIREITNSGISAVVDQESAEKMAQILYDAGEKIFGTDESKFISILAHESVWQVAAIDSAYSRISKRTLREAIKSETSGDFQRALLAVLDFSLDRPSAFARVLYKSMKGLGTDDATLQRIIVSRCEIDMNEIKRAYHKLYNRTLGQDIRGDTSGSYRELLLALINDDETS